MEPLTLVSLGIAVSSLLVSIINERRTWRFTQLAFRRSAEHDHYQELIDIDRNLITYPELWAVFDGHPLSHNPAIKADPVQTARREAYIWAVLTLYEMIYTFYHGRLGRLNRQDREEWESWQSDLCLFVRKSTEARNYFRQQAAVRVFNANFTDFLEKMIAECERGMGSGPVMRAEPA
jgi:hypothetical protein